MVMLFRWTREWKRLWSGDKLQVDFHDSHLANPRGRTVSGNFNLVLGDHGSNVARYAWRGIMTCGGLKEAAWRRKSRLWPV